MSEQDRGASQVRDRHSVCRSDPSPDRITTTEHRHGVAGPDYGEVTLEFGAVDVHPGRTQPVEDSLVGMPVIVVGADRDQPDPGTGCSQELHLLVGAAVVRNLEHICF